MLKSLMRWVDSWSMPAQAKTITAKNTQIQWLRIFPLLCCTLLVLRRFGSGYPGLQLLSCWYFT